MNGADKLVVVFQEVKGDNGELECEDLLGALPNLCQQANILMTSLSLSATIRSMLTPPMTSVRLVHG